MKKLLTSSAVVVIFGGMAFGAQAQTSTETDTQMSANGSLCEMQWIAVDGNDDAFITREEATGTIEEEFAQIDADGNGEIGKTEYIDCKTQGLDMQSAEATRDEESFAAVDVNQDEGIGREEFGQAAEQAFNESRSATSADAEPLITLRRFVWLTPEEASSDMMLNMSDDEAAARTAMTFERLDADGDNIVDTREWAQATTPRGLSEHLAGARFDAIDADASGAIGQDEYISARFSGLDQMETGSVSDAASAPAGATEDESAAVVPDVAADEEQEQARVGVPAFVFRLNDGDWE
jgi:Ca2+-binding EF-hand superfamily protein